MYIKSSIIRDILDLIENNAGGLVDSEQTDHRRYYCNKGEDPVVLCGQCENVIIRNAIRRIARVSCRFLLAILGIWRATG